MTTSCKHEWAAPANSDVAPRVDTTGREVVVNLEAAAAPWDIGGDFAPLEGLSYNGQTPGPTIEARQGDTLVVRLTNRLIETTTIHWHGLRLQPATDRTQDMQRPVDPGETFEYRFALPDAGTFWYHPHASGQLDRGLYGALVVRGEDDPRVDAERVMVFDEVTLDRRGRLARPGGWPERHDGRQGRVGLLNGRVRPAFEMAAGQVERWRLLNTSSARCVRFSIGAAPFRILGADGGLIEAPIEGTDVLVAPADRLDVLIGPFDEGQRFEIQWL